MDAVQLRRVARPDDTGIRQGRGRLFRDRLPEEPREVGAVVQRPGGGSATGGEDCGQLFDPAQRLAHPEQVPRQRDALAAAVRPPLQVAKPAQQLAHLGPQHAVPGESLDRVQAPLERGDVEQGLPEPAAQKTPSHGREGLVEHPEQRASRRAAPDAFRQLEVAPGRLVQRHKLAKAISAQAGDLGQSVFLCFLEVLQQRAGRPGRQWLVLDAVADQRCGAEVSQQRFAAPWTPRTATRRTA